MALELFAGVRVSNFETEHRYLYIDEEPSGAGRARHTIVVDDLDADGSEIGFGGAVE